ncbi:MAG: PfkB family carbohydrate kinase [Myxococcales bacterium]|nr:PfkB family carbohydrate kinase [Myxococcales bacterium]
MMVGRSGSPYLKKLKNAGEIEAICERHREQGNAIVHCHGAFDNLHLGHLRHLAWAKSQGDLLIASIGVDHVLSDGGAAIFSPAEVRAEQLAAIAVVDYVVIDSGEWVGELIRRIRPHYYVKGREFEDVHEGAFGRERRLVEELGGSVRFGSGDVVYSGTDVLRAKQRRASLDHQTIRKYCHKHGLTSQGLLGLLEKAATKKLVVIGESIVDEYVHCDALGMSADAPSLVVRPTYQDRYLGGAGIVAQHIQSLGAESLFISVVGDDFEADFVRNELSKRDLTSQIIVDPLRPTIHKKRFLVDGRKLLNVNTFRDQNASRALEDQLIEAVHNFGSDADLFVISDFSYGIVTERVIDAVASLAQERNVPVVGDTQASSQIGTVTRLKNITATTPSEREARLAVWDREAGIADVGVKLLKETGNRALVITLGHRGCMIFDTGGRNWGDIAPTDWPHEIKRNLTIEYLPSFATHVVDAMGAGDALLSALAVSLSANASMLEGALLGSCASAVAVANLGNAPVRRVELLDRLEEALSEV